MSSQESSQDNMQTMPDPLLPWLDDAFEAGLVSVIVPTYNRANFIVECLDSVYQQSYRPIEVLLVDDGSADDTKMVVDTWLEGVEQDTGFRFRYFLQENKGGNLARNRGALVSKGEFLQFMDSDDVLLCDKIRRAVTLLRKSRAEYVYCPIQHCDEHLNPIEGSFGVRQSGSDDEILRYLWQTMCPLFRRSAIIRAGPWLETLQYAQDWEYAARVRLLGIKGDFDEIQGALFREHLLGRKSSRESKLGEVRSAFIAYQHIFKRADELSKCSPVLRAGLGRKFLAAGTQFCYLGSTTEGASALMCCRQVLRKYSPYSLAALALLGLPTSIPAKLIWRAMHLQRLRPWVVRADWRVKNLGEAIGGREVELWPQLLIHAPSCAANWMLPGFKSNLVSVIIPAFNRAHFLLDCLQSVFSQTYRPIELILVDDGSTDLTAEVFESWREELPADKSFYPVLIRQENQGANVARNRGLLASRGEFIQFLDSDDLLLPEKIRSALVSINKDTADYCYCPVLFRDEELRVLSGAIGAPLSGTDIDVTSYLWQTMGPLYRRDLVRRVGPWLEDIFHADDWEYASRVKLLSNRGCYLSEAGGLLRIHPRPERVTPEGREREYREYHTAYCNARDVARLTGRLSSTVRNRLGRRFLLNALLLGKAGCSSLRSESLKIGRELIPGLGVLACFFAAFSIIVHRRIDALAANSLLFTIKVKAGGKRHCEVAPQGGLWMWKKANRTLAQTFRLSLQRMAQAFRYKRMKLMRFFMQSNASQFGLTSARCVIFLPHPDDESFGMGGTIAAKAAAGAEILIILVTLGSKSHCECCPGTEKVVMTTRRNEFYRSLVALGVRDSSVIEFGMADGGVQGLPPDEWITCRDKISAVLTKVAPEEIYYPAWADSHPDHIGVSQLCREAVVHSRIRCRELRYIIWAWYLPSLQFYKELLRSKISVADTAAFSDSKRRSIAVYLESPPAPCGAPFCGNLPPVLVEAGLASQEFFLE